MACQTIGMVEIWKASLIVSHIFMILEFLAFGLLHFLHHNGEYHGYCTSDLTKVDPGFGSSEILRDLVSRAHELQMYVILDVVVNHLCDRSTHYDHFQHVDCANELNEGIGAEEATLHHLLKESLFSQNPSFPH